jgi:subtilisin family serine protease
MKHKIRGIFVCTLMIVTSLFPAAGTMNKKGNSESILFNDNTNMEFAPEEIIVKLKKNAILSISSLAVLNEKHQVYAFEKVFPNEEDTILDNIYLLRVPRGSNILSIVSEYASCPDVVYVEPNGVARTCGIPDDTQFSNQWSLQNTGQVIRIQKQLGKITINSHTSGTPDADIDAPEAWDIETGDPNVVIAILDTGVDYTHPDLAANIWNNTDENPGNGIDDDTNGYIDDVRGWDFAYHDNDPKDELGHGTACAGIAGAVSNNGIGIAGVCWNCKIMPVQVMNKTGSGYWTDIANGITYAADNGADIISMSLGDESVPNILLDAVNYAYDKGVFLCASAGNHNEQTKMYPAAYENVTAVAMTDLHDKRSHFLTFGSNYGEWVDIAAPGSLIYSTSPTYYITPFVRPNYDSWSGTSFATPMVAGVAALLLSKDPTLTPAEVKALLCNNVDPYHSNKYIGTGRLNAYKALSNLTLSMSGADIVEKTVKERQHVQPSNNPFEGNALLSITPPPTSPVRWTAEWEKSAGVLLAWPLFWSSLDTIYSTMIDKLQDIGIVYLLCKNVMLRFLISLKLITHEVPLDNITWLSIPYASIWTRDYGPLNIYDLESGEWGLVDNIYGHYRDDKVNNRLQRLWRTEYYETPIDVQGGNLCTDGMGRVFCLESIVKENHPTLNEEQLRQAFRDYLNVEMIILPEPPISPHLDMCAKLVDPETWIIGQWPQNDPNTPYVEEIVSILSNMTASTGNLYTIFRIQQPERRPDGFWDTYSNAYMQNGKVLVPLYNIEQDTAALAVFQQALPDWEIIGIECTAFGDIGGAIHCSTHEIAGHKETSKYFFEGET